MIAQQFTTHLQLSLAWTQPTQLYCLMAQGLCVDNQEGGEPHTEPNKHKCKVCDASLQHSHH